MNKNTKILLVILIIIAGLILLLSYGIFKKADKESGMQIANPASVYCEEKGGALEIRTSTDGSQQGFCIFEDGSECEEWAFFRNECKKLQ